MKEYRISNFQEFSVAVKSLIQDFNNVKLWWRGQEDSNWNLIPSIYRPENKLKENNISVLFRLKAKARYPNCPNTDDPFPWLSLMQHYRLPTRLLDWSESPLVALFFAVESDRFDKKDAVIWSLQPYIMNSIQVKKEIIFSPGNLELAHLVKEAFKSNDLNPDLRIAAVHTEQFDIRHLIQQSEFTIHGSSIPIENLEAKEIFLGKIIIPSKVKKSIRVMLEIFGFSRSYLFPDLENLSGELSSMNFETTTQLK